MPIIMSFGMVFVSVASWQATPEQQKVVASLMKRLIAEGYVSQDEWPVLQKKWFKDPNLFDVLFSEKCKCIT